MGIKEKIKDAFQPGRDQPDTYDQDPYTNEPTGSAPGAYPSERDPRMDAKQGPVDRPPGAYEPGAAPPGAAAAYGTNQGPPPSRHARGEKPAEYGRHRPTDSGVAMGDNRPYQGKEPRQEGSAVRNEGAPPYWGAMGTGGRGENVGPQQGGGGEGFDPSQREFPLRSAERPPPQAQYQQQPAYEQRGGEQGYDPRIVENMKPRPQGQGQVYDQNVGGQKMGMMGGPVPSAQQGVPVQSQPQSGMGQGPTGGAGARTEEGSSGPGHFGPGLDGSKVVHKCHACGTDNDISQYFQKNAVYRMS